MRKIWILLVTLAAALLLSGCSTVTVDQMYCLPKRSEQFNNLQSAIDRAMTGKQYSAPLSGENQQTVQQADLDGDGVPEYLLFACSEFDRQLEILVFSQNRNGFVQTEIISGKGTAFDQVEYVQMDGVGGMEIVVGRQVSSDVLRSVCVYSFTNGKAEQLVATNYSKFLTCDLDMDQHSELFVLHPGNQETQRGVAVLYSVEDGLVERSNEVDMSEPAEHLKRIITGKLHGGLPAVFVGSAVKESAIITDVYALVDGVFTNVSFSNESGTSVQTLRNYYVYADDIDGDGEVELPDLITMQPWERTQQTDRHYLIRWYAMNPDGSEVDKMYSFHNFVGGWYLQLNAAWADRITVVQNANSYEFHLWNDAGTHSEKMFTVYAFTGQDREDQAVSGNRFMIYKTDSTVYAAYLEVASGSINLTRDDLINGFHLIRLDWKTGET